MTFEQHAMSSLKKPRLADEAFLADVEAAGDRADELHLWWLGQSGFLVQWQGRHLLLDPYLSDSLTKKYAATDKPHVRVTQRVVDPSRLDFVDVVTSSHNHTDHLDAETIVPILSARPDAVVVVPAANRSFAAERLNCSAERLTPIDDGQSINVAGFTLHGVPAAHETIDRDELGRCRYLGYVVEFGGWTLYHSGDTIRYEGMAETLRRWRIDIALLPINGRSEERRVPGNLWGDEAAELAHDIGARLLIPCHFDMFEFNTVSPDDCVGACRRIDQPLVVLANGERWTGRR